jgi:hypothetical protein
MRCWFHKWTRWSQPYEWKNHWDTIYLRQKRTCTKCGKIEERRI